MNRPTFVIIGLGLIGGSLARAIRKRFRAVSIIGISRDERKIELAKKNKWINAGFTDLAGAFHPNQVKGVRQNRGEVVVFICTPVDVIAQSISEVDRYAVSGTIVTDVGSTKLGIVHWADRKRFRRIKFIGSHPLAGSHLSGIEHAKANLFEGAYVFVTPTKSSDRRAVETVSTFWKTLRMRVRRVSPGEHDRIVSQISHLPHAVASALTHAASSEILRFGASGFLDTTRVAQGDPKLWAPIFLANRNHLLKDLRRFESALHRFTGGLRKGSPASLVRFLKAAAWKRRRVTSRLRK